MHQGNKVNLVNFRTKNVTPHFLSVGDGAKSVFFCIEYQIY